MLGSTEDKNKHICYDDLGCFNNSWPFFSEGAFGRPGRLPLSPEEINSAFPGTVTAIFHSFLHQFLHFT